LNKNHTVPGYVNILPPSSDQLIKENCASSVEMTDFNEAKSALRDFNAARQKLYNYISGLGDWELPRLPTVFVPELVSLPNLLPPTNLGELCLPQVKNMFQNYFYKCSYV
jgi:hypothetical protein